MAPADPTAVFSGFFLFFVFRCGEGNLANGPMLRYVPTKPKLKTTDLTHYFEGEWAQIHFRKIEKKLTSGQETVSATFSDSEEKFAI